MPTTIDNPITLAIEAERADARNWLDQHRAAPDAIRQGLGLAAYDHGGLAMVRSHIPFSHFNMVLTLGCPAAADDAAFAAIDAFYAAGGTGRHWVLVNDHSQPPGLGQRLIERGYAKGEAWDRVVLMQPQPQRWAPFGQDCEAVGPGNAGQWIEFIRGCYGMPPPIGAWLQALVGRPGWFHALRREGGRPGAPVAMARSAFVAADGWCWLGIDAPVPGVMAPCFEDDRHVTAALLRMAAAAGAQHFVSDIEVPAADRQGPAYSSWASLGFEAVYLRQLYAKG